MATLDCPGGLCFASYNVGKRRMPSEHSPKIVSTQPWIDYSINGGKAKMEIPAERVTAVQQPPASGSDYAGFGARALAFLADALVGSVLPMAIAFVLGRTLVSLGLLVPVVPEPVGGSSGGAGFDLVAMWSSMGWTDKLVVIITFNLFQGLLYFALCHSSPWQATVGKRWRHLIVIDLNGARVNFLRALSRALVKVWFGLLLQVFSYPIQIVSVLVNKKHQAIHDKVAKTVVVKARPSAEAHLGYWRVAFFLLIPPVVMVVGLLMGPDFQLP